jgi:ferrous iron transport protein B
VGSLNALYGQMAQENQGKTADAAPFALGPALLAAIETVPKNLAALSGALLDPLQIDVGDVSSVEQAAITQNVNVGIFGMMALKFDGIAGAIAFLLFILLYSPCAATVGAIARETSLAWAGFVVVWTTGIAYVVATLFYQSAQLLEHPASAAAWVAGVLLFLVAVVGLLRHWGYRGMAAAPRQTSEAHA